MNDENRAKYASKHPEDVGLNLEIANKIKAKQEDGRLACAAAITIAKECDETLAEVGRNADLLETRIDKCLLGLFGFEKVDGKKRRITAAESVPRDVEKAIRCRLTDGRLTCKTCWEIAASLGESKYSVSQAAEALEIKISKCQIGAF